MAEVWRVNPEELSPEWLDSVLALNDFLDSLELEPEVRALIARVELRDGELVFTSDYVGERKEVPILIFVPEFPPLSMADKNAGLEPLEERYKKLKAKLLWAIMPYLKVKPAPKGGDESYEIGPATMVKLLLEHPQHLHLIAAAPGGATSSSSEDSSNGTTSSSNGTVNSSNGTARSNGSASSSAAVNLVISPYWDKAFYRAMTIAVPQLLAPNLRICSKDDTSAVCGCAGIGADASSGEHDYRSRWWLMGLIVVMVIAIISAFARN